MASGKNSARGGRLKRSCFTAFTASFLIFSLAFSPIVLANQTPASVPEVPPSVDNPDSDEPTGDDPAPDPIVPDPDVPLPENDDPGESENSPEPEPDPDVPTQSDEPEDPNPDDANPDVPESGDPGDLGDEEDGVGDGTDSDQPGSDDTNSEGTGPDGEPVDEPSGNEDDPEQTDDSDGAEDLTPEEIDPAATPTEAPEPTETPLPVVTWNYPGPVSCALLEGSSSEMAFNDSSAYRCLAAVNVSSDSEMPADMQIQWQVDVDFPDAYSFGLPEGSQAAVLSQSPGASVTATQIVLTQPWQGDSAMQTVEFDISLTRTTCVVGEQVLTVQAVPSLSTLESEADIQRPNGSADPQTSQFINSFIPSGAPTVAFDGPVTFAALSATASGLESDVSRGTATIAVSGEWDPCTTWFVNLNGIVDMPAETPATLHVVSVNGESLSGGACDLSAPCDVIVLPEVGDAASPHTYTIGLELQLHDFTPVGDFGISLTTDVRGEGTQP